MIVEIFEQIAGSPVLALLGALVVITVLVIPLVLRLAGLTGAQIAELLETLARISIDLVKAFRAQNKSE